MDEDEELRKFKRIIIAIALFFICGWFAVGELRYMAFGNTADATVTELFETKKSRRWSQYSMLAVRYSFTDEDGTTRTERDDVPLDWEPADGSTLAVGSKTPVEYLPGVEDKSRLSGNGDTFALVIFLIALAAIAAFGVWLWRHASEAVHGRR